MSKPEFTEISCTPSDGLYKDGHPECEKCYYRVRQLCQLFTIDMDRAETADVLEEETIRDRERNV